LALSVDGNACKHQIHEEEGRHKESFKNQGGVSTI
jgi:hypothetical protein